MRSLSSILLTVCLLAGCRIYRTVGEPGSPVYEGQPVAVLPPEGGIPPPPGFQPAPPTTTTTTTTSAPPPPPPAAAETQVQPPPPPPRTTTSTQFPVAKPVPGKPGFVYSPFDASGTMIDVTGYPSGMKVKDPETNKIFIVP